MSADPFLSFILFVQSDKKVEDLKRKQEQLDATLHQAQLHIIDEREVCQAMRTDLHAAQRKYDALELDIRALRIQLSQAKDRHALAASVKDFSATQHEIASLEQAIDANEDFLLTQFDTVQSIDKQLAECMFRFDAQISTWQNAIDRAESDCAVNRTQLSEAESACFAARQRVLPDFLEMFDARKKAVKNPVVSVSNGHCSACFGEVSLQDRAVIKRQVLCPCKSCYRLLIPEYMGG